MEGTDKHIWIKYKKEGATVATYREIHSVKWLDFPYKITAVCVRSEDRKTYRLDRMEDVTMQAPTCD